MRADAIASHGRVGQVEATALGSWGRITQIGELVIEYIGAEIINLTSGILRVLNLESKL